MVKVTFTFDDRTASRLRQTATLATLDAIVSRKRTRTSADVDRELRAIRTARRGGCRHRS